MGRFATFFGTVVSIGAAYLAAQFNNIMDVLQLVFGFVNAPLFATFLLGMFWKRTTGHGAFTGLLAGTTSAAIFHGLTLPAGNAVGVKGAGCRSTIRPHVPQRDGAELLDGDRRLDGLLRRDHRRQPRHRAAARRGARGLVYALTEKPQEGHLAWYQRPVTLGIVVLLMTLALNFLFF